MKNKIFALLLLAPFMAGAQQMGSFMAEANGMPGDVIGKSIATRVAYDVEGTPFFNKEYCKARLAVHMGKTFQDVPVKLNLAENLIYFKRGDGVEQIPAMDIDKLEFTECANELGKVARFQSGFPAIERQTAKTYYQVLSFGKVSLLKYHNVTFREGSGYGSATVVRSYESNPQYYAYSPEMGIVRISKNNDAVLKVLAPQKASIEKYMSEHNIKSKKEEEMISVFDYYNTL